MPRAGKIMTLIAEPDYSPEAVEIYRKLGPVNFWFGSSKKNREKLLSISEILVVRLMLAVDKKLMDKMPDLKVIATSTTGLNHIDMSYAEKRGIKVISLRGETAFLKKIPSTAEETWGLIIALLRNIPWAFDDVRQGRWRTNRWAGHELAGKAIGILGFGRLGRIVARYAKAFGMKVLVSDPYVPANIIKKSGAEKTSMDALFKRSDIVSAHVLLTKKTANLIRKKHFQMMKPGAYFINTARAELVEKGAMLSALKQKRIAGAAVDVLYDEKDDARHMKKNAEAEYAKKNNNLIILPHIGGTTYEAMATTQEFIAGLVAGYFKKHRV